jgi:hydroxymethylpyrimidine/phosphomethylpyrimidine kinase
MKKILTIAGSDCSGGAGIQADIKTITAHRMYAMSAITALTAQNTTGVYGIFEAEPDFVAQELDCIFTDIFPDAVKVGMVSSAEIIGVIAEKLREYAAKNIVVDPVMVSTSGSPLLKPAALDALKTRIFPLADILTPNIHEAELLCGFPVDTPARMVDAARQIASLTKGHVLIKGGHLADTADDLLYGDGEERWIQAPRVENPNTHGTGCTLSSAIACNLADGRDMYESVARAKRYVTGALSAGLDLGRGSGPLDHTFDI